MKVEKEKVLMHAISIFIILFFSLFSLIVIPDMVHAQETVVTKLEPGIVGEKAITIDVIVGKETVLKLKQPIERIRQVSLANEDVAAIKPLLSFPATKTVELVIYGKKLGITSLIVWDKEGKKSFFDVIVHKESLAEIERERAEGIEKKIREALKKEPPDLDVKVEIVGGTVILNGTAHNRQIIDKIENIAMLYATKDCEGISRSCSLLEGCIARKGSEAKIGGVGILPIVSLEGTPGGMTPAEKGVLIEQKTERKALCVLNLITMPEAQQVLLEVKVAQIDKSKLKELGVGFILQGVAGNNAEIIFPGLTFFPTGILGKLDTTETNIIGLGPTGETIVTDRFLGKSDLWPGVTGFDIETNPPQIGIAHFPSGVASALRALSSKGLAKILAEPNLVVRSGEKGNFLAGTKVPIQVIIGTPPTPSIEYIDVGVKLNFAPEVLETGAIRLKIDPAEVSSIIRYVTFTGGLIAPEIDTREVRTSIDIKEGESLILAGLLSEEMKKGIQKIPILGDIPILGAFFRSTSDELKEKELAFFITPKLVKPIAPGVKIELPGDNRPTPDEEREFQWIPLPKERAQEGESVPEGKIEPAAKPAEGKSE